MENQNKYEKYISSFKESSFISTIKKFAKKAGLKVIYTALVLFYVLKDGKTPLAEKAKIMGALGYLVLPVDLIPDFIPIVGFTDDLAALLWAYHTVQANITPEIEAKAQGQLKEWFPGTSSGEINTIKDEL